MEINNSSHAPENGQAPNQDPQPQAGTSNVQATNETPTQTLEDLQRQIQELRKENAKHRNKAKEQEDAAQEAERKRLAEQGQYKELAEKHEQRVRELEPLQGRYTELSQLVSQQIDTQIKDWPAEVKSLVPDATTPVEQRVEQVDRLRPLVEKLKLQEQGNRPGNAPNPRPSQQPAEGNNYYQKLRASGKYGA